MDIKIHKVTGITFNDMVFDDFVTRKIVIDSDESGKIEIVLFAKQLDQLAMTYNGATYHD
jgi:hypothetical protein